MKRIILACLLVIALTAALAACGGSPAGSGGAATTAAQNVQTTQAAAEAPAQEENPIKSVDDLNGRTIGVQLGTTGDIYAEDIEDATVERFKTGAEAVLSLRQRKVDAVIIDDQPAKVYASLNDDIMVLDEPFTVEEYAICLAKDNSELTAQFNTAIAEVRANGTLTDILNHFIGQEEGTTPYVSPEGTAYPNGTLVMATNAEFPPYEYFEDGEVVGIDASFAKAICDRLGYDLRIDHMDFDSIITAVQTGRADFGAAGMTVTEDRLRNIDFTDTYITASQVVIVRK